ncbi:MAG: lipopolysaccharide biosynthesis protein [Erysipelotrichaceae bacterium]
MKLKKVLMNFFSDVVPLLVIAILGIFKSKLFIKVLGTETLGLYNLFSQVMVYVAVVDGGLSSAVLFSLYRPNSEKDEQKINEILSAALKAFSLIGIVVFTIAFAVSFFVPFLIKDSIFQYSYIVLTFLLFALSSVISYFFVPYYCLLEVKEKRYIYNLIVQLSQMSISLLEIFMLIKGYSFISILLMHSIIKLISCCIEAIICRFKFPQVDFHSEKKDYSFKKHISSLAVHKINGLVGSNIDTLIISRILGLSSVAIYTTYHYFVNMLKMIFGKIEYSLTAIVGNAIASGKKDEIEQLHDRFNNLLFFLAIIISVPLSLAINDFIDIWYENTIYTSNLIAISFSLLLYISIIKMSTTLFITSAGYYRETKHCAIVDTVVNLSLSLILVHYVGISGVIVATVVSVFIAEYILKTRVLYKNLFKGDYLKLFFNNLKFFLLTVVDFLFGYIIINPIEFSGVFHWFFFFVFYTVGNALIILAVFYFIGELNFIGGLKKIFKKKEYTRG